MKLFQKCCSVPKTILIKTFFCKKLSGRSGIQGPRFTGAQMYTRPPAPISTLMARWRTDYRISFPTKRNPVPDIVLRSTKGEEQGGPQANPVARSGTRFLSMIWELPGSGVELRLTESKRRSQRTVRSHNATERWWKTLKIITLWTVRLTGNTSNAHKAKQ